MSGWSGFMNADKCATYQQREVLRGIMMDGRVMRWSEMEGHGISRRAMMGMLSSGDLVRVDHGLYRLTEAPVNSMADWDDIAAKYTSEGFVICLLTAAKHHGLVTQMPIDVWVGLPVGSKPTKPGVRPVFWRRTDSSGKPHASWAEGVERLDVGGRSYKITNAPRTVVDLYRWRHKLPDGERICFEALREYDDKKMNRSDLRKIAHIFGVGNEISELLMAKSEFTSDY